MGTLRLPAADAVGGYEEGSLMSCYRKGYIDRHGVRRRCRTWVIDTRDSRRGRVVIATGMRDKSAAHEMERRIGALVDARMARLPITDDTMRWIEGLSPAVQRQLADAEILTGQQVAALRPLTDLVDEWAVHLAGRDTSKAQIAIVTMRARKLFAGAGAVYYADLDPAAVERWLADYRASENIAARTSNGYLDAARQFARWAVRSGFAHEDPLRTIETLHTASDRRRVRRALTTDEAMRLVAAAAEGPPIEGFSGKFRALIYRLALETGLRKNEIKTLKVADFDLRDFAGASVRARAPHTKNREEARLDLREPLARDLAARLRARWPGGPAFDLPGTWTPQRWVAADLAAAGVPVKDEAGRVADFHALRATYCTSLARSGAPPQVQQRMMRHADPRLTANVYTVLGRDDEREALARLPDYTAAAHGAQASGLATGTDDLQRGGWDATAQIGADRPATSHIGEAPPEPRASSGGTPNRASDRTESQPAAPLVDRLLDRVLAAWDRLDERERQEVVRCAEGFLR